MTQRWLVSYTLGQGRFARSFEHVYVADTAEDAEQMARKEHFLHALTVVTVKPLYC